MNHTLTMQRFGQSATKRLAALGSLDEQSLNALRRSVAQADYSAPEDELLREGEEIARPRLLVSGWAAQVRLFPDGSRQLLSFLLPGDLIGYCTHSRQVAMSTVIALTDVVTSAAPAADHLPALKEIYELARACEETHLLAQISRLGRLAAHERLCDLFLELDERLTLCGLSVDGTFAMPLTQETMADALGLTPVHLNRTLQQARKDGEIEWRHRTVTLPDRAELAARVGRKPIRVTAG